MKQGNIKMRTTPIKGSEQKKKLETLAPIEVNYEKEIRKHQENEKRRVKVGKP